jgi:hypothetical protein
MIAILLAKRACVFRPFDTDYSSKNHFNTCKNVLFLHVLLLYIPNKLLLKASVIKTCQSPPPPPVFLICQTFQKAMKPASKSPTRPCAMLWDDSAAEAFIYSFEKPRVWKITTSNKRSICKVLGGATRMAAPVG